MAEMKKEVGQTLNPRVDTQTYLVRSKVLHDVYKVHGSTFCNCENARSKTLDSSPKHVVFVTREIL